MGVLVSMDPGLREIGLAKFIDGKLDSADAITRSYGEGPVQWVATAKAAAEWIDGPVDTLAIEYMVTRQDAEYAHDALMKLSQVAGATYALVGADSKVAVEPRDWTRRRPKRINWKRAKKRLDDDEMAAWEDGLSRAPADNEKELKDAVAIGLHVLQRL